MSRKREGGFIIARDQSSSSGSLESRVGKVASAYAEALLPLAQKALMVAQSLDELTEFAELVRAEPDLARVLDGPYQTKDEKVRIVSQICGEQVSDLVCDALCVIARRGRFGMLDEIVEAYRRIVEAAQGRVDVQITSAVAMDDATRATVVERLSDLLKARPVLHERVDPEMLGGLMVQVGSKVFDASVAGELERLRRKVARVKLRTNEIEETAPAPSDGSADGKTES